MLPPLIGSPIRFLFQRIVSCTNSKLGLQTAPVFRALSALSSCGRMITASAHSLKHALRGAQKTFCFALLTNNHFSHNALPFRISHCLPTSAGNSPGNVDRCSSLSVTHVVYIFSIGLDER
jgi:hypothetical protein